MSTPETLRHYEIHAIDQELIRMRDIQDSIGHSERLANLCDERIDWLLDQRNEAITKLFVSQARIVPVAEPA